MVDARILELINAEIDGELDAAARAELEAGLRADPEAGALRDDLLRVAAALQRMRPVPIPGKLHEQLSAGVASATHKRMPWSKRWLRWRWAGAASGGFR